MSVFTDPELAYLAGERRLTRIATVGKDGMPHVVPVGWSYSSELDTIDVGGRQLEQSKKFRDSRTQRTGFGRDRRPGQHEPIVAPSDRGSRSG